MKIFKDSKSNSWELSINVTAIKRVRDLLNADLLDIQTTMPRLLSDPIFLVDVLYCLCKTQLEGQGITDEQFGELMAGDILGAAKNALVEELKSFFPSPQERAAVDKAIQKGTQMVNLIREKSIAKMETMDMDSEVDKILDDLYGKLSMNLPESSESSPEISPSAS